MLNEKSFQGLLNLETLDLSNNDLTYVDGAFANMTRLTRLDLHDNNLTSLTRFTFRDLSGLQFLLLGGNAINNIEREAFRNLEKLMYLVLRGNPIGAIPRLEFSTPGLNFVDLSECGLNRLPRGLPSSIRYLQLRRNNLTVLRKNAFIECPYVGILILDDNGLKEIENKTFIHMTYLQQLWLNNNKLTAIPQLLPPSVQRLYLDINQISSLTDVFSANSQIDTLSLMGNNISTVSSEALRRLPKLRTLDLSNNALTELRGHTFSKSTQLRRLLLSKNPLQYLHHHSLRGLRALRSFSLAYITGETMLPTDLFDDLRQLRTLDLTNSPSLIKAFVDSLSISALSPQFSQLEELSLLGSSLSHLSAGVFNTLPTLKTLQLSSTRLHCDTSLTWLRDWLRSTRVQVDDRISIVCFSPRHLYLKPIVSLADDEFALATTTISMGLTSRSSSTIPTADIDISPEDLQPGSGQQDGEATDYEEPENTDEENEDRNIDKVDDYDRERILDIDDDGSSKSYARSTDNDLLPPPLAGMTHPVTAASAGRRYPVEPEWNDHDYNDEQWGDNVEDKMGYDGTEGAHRQDQFDEVQIHNETTVGANTDAVRSSQALSAVIVAMTAVATIGAAAFLIFLIVRLSKKQPKNSHTNGTVENGQNAKLAVQYQKKSNGVYIAGRPGNNIYMSSANGTKENTESLLSDSMTLVPGRDINHEGPLRVYKWEEF